MGGFAANQCIRRNLIANTAERKLRTVSAAIKVKHMSKALTLRQESEPGYAEIRKERNADWREVQNESLGITPKYYAVGERPQPSELAVTVLLNNHRRRGAA